jgi:hypothetical protein
MLLGNILKLPKHKAIQHDEAAHFLRVAIAFSIARGIVRHSSTVIDCAKSSKNGTRFGIAVVGFNT